MRSPIETELTARELVILVLPQQGTINEEIGVALEISTRTIQKHLRRICPYLGVETRIEAIVASYTQDPHDSSPTLDSIGPNHV